jgi:hypothetical protein
LRADGVEKGLALEVRELRPRGRAELVGLRVAARAAVDDLVDRVHLRRLGGTGDLGGVLQPEVTDLGAADVQPATVVDPQLLGGQRRAVHRDRQRLRGQCRPVGNRHRPDQVGRLADVELDLGAHSTGGGHRPSLTE